MSSSKEIIKTVEDLGREKGISREILADALHEAIVAATVKRIGKYLEPEVTVDLDKGLINILIPKEVSESEESNWYEITMEEAKEYKENPQYGDILMVPTTLDALGRQAALVAKQKLIEKLKEAEKQGFNLLVAFPQIDVTYENPQLFASFGARLPDKRRPEIKEILETYGMTEYDEFELLKRSGAKLPTDNYEFVI